MVQGTVVRLQNLPGCTSLIQHNAETCLGVMVLSWPIGYQNRSSVGSESNAGNGGDELIVSAIAYTQLFMSLKNVKRVKCHGFMLIPCPWSKSSWKLTKGSWKSSFSSESREVGISYSIYQLDIPLTFRFFMLFRYLMDRVQRVMLLPVWTMSSSTAHLVCAAGGHGIGVWAYH